MRLIRLVRTGLEVTVVAIGWLLGGVVGLGTVLYAVAIGPLVQLMLPWCIVELPDRARAPDTRLPPATRTMSFLALVAAVRFVLR